MVSEYIFSGSLPESATTYVRREADDQLYNGLKSGTFCYVLNSRQMGKSSLRVRTQRRLTEVGFACAAIDLSFDEVQEVTSEQWYINLIDTLIDSFDLELDLEEWWYSRQMLSALKRFRKFIEEVLLVEVNEQIVIFIDEIDSVLSLKFPTDDFFAFIRACHNQRADNPQYNRLTFCLLGVASPSNLIEDKRRTPFNIGQAITLSGFRLHEVEPLIKGLSDRFSNPQTVMQEILDWTGGQPFLTQKLCQLMVSEAEKEHPRSVEQVVREQIIDNWEAQDEPEHLRTIRDRIITRDEQKAGYLLELYQQIWQQGKVESNNTGEQSELQLSGLVVRRGGKLSIYNPIYREVFNLNWIELQLAALRPYSEAFRAWVASGCQEESRLLRGKTLRDAQAWAKGKDLSYQDKQFLAASGKREIEEQIAQEKKEAELERERKDREAAQKRNEVLAEANQKAKRRIQIGGAVLIIAVLGATVSFAWSGNRVLEANSQVKEAKKEVKQAQQREEKALKNEQLMQKSAGDAKQEKEASEKALTETNKKLETSRQESEELAQKAQQATQETRQAQEKLGEAKERVKIAEQNVQKLNRAGQQKARKLEEAKKELQLAQQEQKSAQANLANVQEKYQQTQASLDIVTTEIKTVSLLSKLAGELQNNGLSTDAQEAWSQASQATDETLEKEKNRELKQAMLQASISLASLQLSQKYQELDKPEEAREYWGKAEQAIEQSQNLLPSNTPVDTPEQWSIRVHVKRVQGSLLKQEGKTENAIKNYKEAFDTLHSAWSQFPKVPINTEMPILSFLRNEQPILSTNAVENLHREYIELLSQDLSQEKQADICQEFFPEASSQDKQPEICRVKASLKEHLLAELNQLMTLDNWKDADRLTSKVMVYIAEREEQSYLDTPDIEKFSCPALRTIDTLWVEYSDGTFGFSEQKRVLDKILAESEQPERSYTELDSQEWWKFYERVGWREREEWFNYSDFTFNPKKAKQGHLPLGRAVVGRDFGAYVWWVVEWRFFSLTATCRL